MVRIATAAAVIALLFTPACKKDKPKKRASPLQAPSIATPPPTKATPLARSKTTRKVDDWRNTRLDARPPNRAKAAPPPSKVAAKKDGGPPSDADLAAQKAARDRSHDEKVLDSRLRAASSRLGACMRKSGARQQNANVRIRVHRSGYIMSATASGVSADVQTCINSALSTVRLGSLRSADGLTVTRTFKLFDKNKNNSKKKPGK